MMRKEVGQEQAEKYFVTLRNHIFTLKLRRKRYRGLKEEKAGTGTGQKPRMN